MTIDATAAALVGDEAMPAPEAPQMSEDDALGAVFDKFREDGEPEVVEPEPEAEPEQAETSEEQPEPEDEAEESPGTLPASVRAVWSSLPKDARDALARSQNEMSRKLAEQGRLMSGLRPIQDAVVSAAKDMPFLADMHPGQVASEIMQLARAGQELASKPAETILGFAKKYGVEAQLAAALSGKEAAPEAAQATALKNEIASLKQQLQRVTDPEYLRSQVSSITTETRVIDEVSKFSSTAEHWAEVEPHLPLVIPAVKAKLGESASPSDVLKAAYDLALNIYLPDLQAKQAASTADADATDPKKAEAALKAKSVNISGKSSGKTRQLSEDEMLAAAYDRARAK